MLPDAIGETGWWTGGLEEEAARTQRAIQVATRLHEWADRDERIGIISHGGFISRLLRALFNQPMARLVFYQHYNTALTRIRFRDGGLLIPDYINRVDHLPAALIS